MMTKEEVAAILARATLPPELQLERSVETLEAMPREHRASWIRMGIQLQNGVPIAKAKARLKREIAAIDARGSD